MDEEQRRRDQQYRQGVPPRHIDPLAGLNTLALTTLGPGEYSVWTRWHGAGYESVVIQGNEVRDELCLAYDSEEEAQRGHNEIVERLNRLSRKSH